MIITRAFIRLIFICFLTVANSMDLSAQSIEPETPSSSAEEESEMAPDKMPEFPGGPAEMFLFLTQHIKYPVEAKSEGIQGIVFVEFRVEKDGTLADIQIQRGVHPSLDNEALRVVKSMPNWEPGAIQGDPIAVKYGIPIKFSLANKRKKRKR